MGQLGVGESDTLIKALKMALRDLKSQGLKCFGVEMLRFGFYFNETVSLYDTNLAMRMLGKLKVKIDDDNSMWSGTENQKVKVILEVF